MMPFRWGRLALWLASLGAFVVMGLSWAPGNGGWPLLPLGWLLLYLLLLVGGVTRLCWQMFVPVRCHGSPTTKTNYSEVEAAYSEIETPCIKTGRVALTFDDGPDPEATPALLELLRGRGVQVAFFCTGEAAQQHPQLVQQIHNEGHLVANHSYSHSPLLNLYSVRRYLDDLQRAEEVFVRLLGLRPCFYRPPVGLSNPRLVPVVRKMSLVVVGWQVRSLDLRGAPPAQTIARVLHRLREGGIVLLHDRAPHQLQIVEGILDGLPQRQLQPLRLDYLLELPPYDVVEQKMERKSALAEKNKRAPQQENIHPAQKQRNRA